MKMRLWVMLVLSWLVLGCGRAPPPVPQRVSTVPPAVADLPPTGISLEGATGTASTARNLYFVFDGSGSMADPLRRRHGGNRFRSKLEGAQWAVREFLKSVPDDVHLGLYVFDAHGPREVVPLGAGNRDQFLAAVNAVQAQHGTPLGESIVHAVEALAKQYRQQLGYGEFRIIVVTDGLSNGQISLADAARRATAAGFPIYTIGLDMAEHHELRDYSVKYYAADSFEELKLGLQDAAAESETFDPTEFVK